MRIKNNSPLMKKIIRLLKKHLTKSELKNVLDNFDHWEIFYRAYEEKNKR